jgi:hypothetical protein
MLEDQDVLMAKFFHAIIVHMNNNHKYEMNRKNKMKNDIELLEVKHK